MANVYANPDLGGQLLQALVAGQETKEKRARLQLADKEMTLRERQQQLDALQYADPAQEGFQQILSGLLGGAQVQPKVSPEQQQFNELQGYLKANPDVADMYHRIQATGQMLPPGEAIEGARIAAGTKVSTRDRISAFHDLLEQFGSPAAKSIRGAYASELGISLPQGVPTLGERAVGAQEKQAKVAGSAAEAARIRAQQESYEFVSQGFKPTPGSAAEQDPELFKRLVGEVVDFNLGRTGTISPEAASSILPTSTWARVMKAASEPSPEFARRFETWKTLLDFANKSKGKVSKEMLDQIQTLGQSIYDEVIPPPQEGAPIAEGEGGFVSSVLGRMLGAAFSPLIGGETPQVTLSGRPLRPELQETLDKVVKQGRASLRGTMTGGVSTAAEFGLSVLDKAYQEVLPLITTDVKKPPKVEPTLGPLTSPEAKSIPPEVKTKMQGLAAAYRAAGGTAEEAATIERELMDVLASGDQAALKEYVDALTDDIRSMKATGVAEPRE